MEIDLIRFVESLRNRSRKLTRPETKVSTVALSASLTHLAVGLADGTVLLYKHVSSSLQSSSSLTSFPKHRIVHESPTEPITGLGFREASDDVPHIYLFIVTINRTLTYLASAKGSGAATATVVDEVGSGLGCATMDWRGKEMIVARDEAVYLCGTDGRGPCYAYEGETAFSKLKVYLAIAHA
jgi:hypothetical protein